MKSLESLRVGRDGYKRERKLSSKTDRISTHGRFNDAGEIRRSRPIPLKEPETLSAPPFRKSPEWDGEGAEGTGIIFALLAAFFLYAVGLILVFWVSK